MARRILLACLACFWFQFIFSQSMSDDQVVRYVMEQQREGERPTVYCFPIASKGCDGRPVATYPKKKYEAEQKSARCLGFDLDLTGTTQAKKRYFSFEDQQRTCRAMVNPHPEIRKAQVEQRALRLLNFFEPLRHGMNARNRMVI